MKKILPSLVAVLLYVNSFASTIISSNILSNTTWSFSGSPYMVTINLTVMYGATLTVDPGVVVMFNNNCEMDLRGQLIAIGDVSDSITFTSSSSNPTQGIWDGIRITGTNGPGSDQVTLKYCKGMYADRFVDMDLAYNGPYIYEHCLFYHNTYVSWDGGDPTVKFSYCKFIGNYSGLNADQFGGVVRQSYFLNNTYGVDGFSNVDTCYFSGNSIALSAYGAAIGNTVENNGLGVRAYFNAVNDTFMYNTVRNNNVGIELLSYFNGYISFYGNNICNNTVYNVRLLTANDADLSNNCWCDNDSAGIRSLIEDYYVNPSYGRVRFLPLATSCPIIPISVPEYPDKQPVVLVYPNPSSGIFTVRTSLVHPAFTLYDVSGKELFHSHDPKSTDLLFDLTTYASGIYFLRTVGEGEVYFSRIIKE